MERRRATIPSRARRPRSFRFLRCDRRLLWLRLLRAGLAGLSRLSPALSACWAEALFRTPPRQPRTRRESTILSSGRFQVIRGEAGNIATWRWGEGPVVLLVHGWGGHAGRLCQFVAPLRAAGFSVISFDAPAHGDSAGRRASLPEMARSIAALAHEFGPLAAVIAHSLGATASALAMRRGLKIERAIFLAPAADPEHYSDRFGNLLQISRSITKSMKHRLVERYRSPWSEFRIVDWAASMSSSLLIIHDRRDFKVPLRDGQAIARAWPGSELMVTGGLGHHKILRAPQVIGRALAFLAPGWRPAQPQPGETMQRKIRKSKAGSGKRLRLLKTAPVYAAAFGAEAAVRPSPSPKQIA